MFFVVYSIVLTALFILAIAFAARADRGRILAERALRLCQESMMRGSSILRHRRPNPHRFTDPVVEIIYAEGTGMAFRDAALREAQAFYREIEPELPSRK